MGLQTLGTPPKDNVCDFLQARCQSVLPIVSLENGNKRDIAISVFCMPSRLPQLFLNARRKPYQGSVR